MVDLITCEPHFSKADTMKKMPYLSRKQAEYDSTLHIPTKKMIQESIRKREEKVKKEQEDKEEEQEGGGKGRARTEEREVREQQTAEIANNHNDEIRSSVSIIQEQSGYLKHPWGKESCINQHS